MRHSDPSSPEAWMARARSDLALARLPASDVILLEDLCFHAQQAAEKSIKAILISHGIPFPKTHSIERLIDLLPTDIPRPADLEESSRLTVYATVLRYPGLSPVSEDKYRNAVRLAEAVVKWAEDILKEADAL